MIKVINQLRIDEQIAAAGFPGRGFERFDKTQVLAQKGAFGVKLALDQTVLNEQAARGTRIDRGIARAAAGNRLAASRPGLLAIADRNCFAPPSPRKCAM